MKPYDINLPYDATGKPKHFDPNHYLDSVEQMICADELVTALYMLEHMPGYYRDNIPVRAIEIKKKLYRQLMTVEDYVFDVEERQDNNEIIHKTPLQDQHTLRHFFPRAPITIEIVEQLNKAGYVANITEVGPANYWLPAALNKLKLEYTYCAHSISAVANGISLEDKKDELTNKPAKNMFICFETIEHLWNPDDIYHYYAKHDFDADVILLSTPKYVLYGGLPNWDRRPLGHVRTYTPTELVEFAKKHWLGYKWTLHDSDMMVLVGMKQ